MKKLITAFAILAAATCAAQDGIFVDSTEVWVQYEIGADIFTMKAFKKEKGMWVERDTININGQKVTILARDVKEVEYYRWDTMGKQVLVVDRIKDVWPFIPRQ